MPDPTQEARQAVLSKYRWQRKRGDRPYVAMTEVFADAALDVAFHAEYSGSVNAAALARFTAAKAYKAAIMARKQAEADRRDVTVSETFWHHGKIGGRP